MFSLLSALKLEGSDHHKQEELEDIVQQENYDILAITEIWWDDSHDWSAAMGGCKLFRRVPSP